MPHTSICNPTAFASQLHSHSPELQQHFLAPLGQDFPFSSHSLIPGNPSVVDIACFPRHDCDHHENCPFPAWLWLLGCTTGPKEETAQISLSTPPGNRDSMMSSDLRELWGTDKNQVAPSCTGSDWDRLLFTGATMVLWFGFVTKPVLTRHQYFGYFCTRLSLFLHSAHHQWPDVHLHLWLLTGKLHCPQTCLNILGATSPAISSTYLKQKMYKIQTKHCSLFKSYRSNTILAFSFFCALAYIFSF